MLKLGPRPGQVLRRPLSRVTLEVEQLEDIIAPTTGLVSYPDAYSVALNTPLNVSTSGLGVLANDYMASGNGTASIAMQPQNGTVQLNQDGTFLYTPDQDYSGVDSFDYLLTSGTNTTIGTAYIGVGDHDPFAVGDTFNSVDHTGTNPVITSTQSVMANDLLENPTTATATLTSTPTHGTLNWNIDGTFTYTPNPWFLGVDSFQYQVTDGQSTSNVGTVFLKMGMRASTPALLFAAEGTQINQPLTIVSGGGFGTKMANFDVSINWGPDTTPGNAMLAGRDQYAISFPYTYLENGQYPVQIQITHVPDGSTIVTDTMITVDNVAPFNVDSGSAMTSLEGDEISLTGSFQDPGTEDTHTYLWEVFADNGQSIPSGTSDTFNFTPVDNGEYTVTLTVTDDDGGSGVDSFVISVQDVAPTLSLTGEDLVNEGVEYTLNLSSSDVGTDTITEWQIDWGDGTGVQTVTGDPNSVTHTYMVPGNYDISASVVDEDGTHPAFDTHNVEVVNLQPELVFFVTYGVQQMVTLHGQVTDPNPGGLTVTFSGMVEGSTTTDATGAFSYTASASALGDVTAKVIDAGGLWSDPVQETLTTVPPVILDFTIVHQFGNTYEFRGRVQDESAPGLVVTFNGLDSLQGDSTEVATDKTFSLWVELEDGETGAVCVNVTDWWGVAAPTVYYYI